MNRQDKKAATAARETTRTAKVARIADINAAPLNVHRVEGKDIDGGFKGLVESIRRNGMIARIVVRPGEDGKYVVVDGHRRFEAAKALGWAEVPVDVVGVEGADALAQTVAANVQRIPNDPLLEAEAIERMSADGMTRQEIAAALGMDAGYVARRQRLTALTEPWRAFARRVKCTTDLLERVAAHEPTLQLRVAETSGLDEYEQDWEGACPWSEFESAFKTEMRSIPDAAFDTTECAKCPSNTANHDYLFDFMIDCNGACARCQDAACFARKTNAEIDALVERLRRTSRPAVEVSDQWRVPEYWNASAKKNPKHPQAYVFEQNGLRRVLWSVPPPQKEKLALTPEEKAERKAAKRRVALMSSARGKVRSLLEPDDSGRIAFFDDGGQAAQAYEFIALSRLERDLSKPFLADGLVDDVVRACQRIPALQEALDADELGAYREMFAAEDARKEGEEE
jgi:ParB/RepB/Spo0J family partition protein